MEERLEKYKRKRNFEKTLEPEGEADFGKEGLRFAVQHHIARRDHYDFRLEWNGVLLSWAVPKGPSFDVREKRLAVRVEDHPVSYRNFEGTIPKGQYGGGTVMLWDEGFWEPGSEVEEGLKKGSLKFTLKGKRLMGKWALMRMKTEDEKENWILIKEKDGYAKSGNGISVFSTSIRTGRTMEEIEAGENPYMKNPFEETELQLAKLEKALPSGGDWIYELKYDGYRIVAYTEGGGVRLVSRNGNDYTKYFPEAAEALTELSDGRAMILDGEMVIMDESGKTDFQALQNYMKNSKGKNLTYVIFDLLSLDGKDMRDIPLLKRKEALENLLRNAPPPLLYSCHVKGGGEESLAAACGAGMEGIVGKKPDSVYSGKRNGDWIKIKCGMRQEFVVGGYTLSDKKSAGVSSLLLGVYENGELVYSGRAGTGFKEADMAELNKKFESVKIKKAPFKNAPKPKSNEEIFWLEPKFVAEIKFAEWTKDNLLRQASFKGMRSDKNPKDIIRENTDAEGEPSIAQAEGETQKKMGKTVSIEKDTVGGIKITNPDKVIFEDPDITKGAVADYYSKAAETMLPYINRRILSIIRCPKGVSQACFFKKHPGPDSKGVVKISVPAEGKKNEEFFYIESAEGLIHEAQMGTLEFHIWGSHAETLDQPDLMVFDLDPDEGMDLKTLRQGVKDIKSVLDELSLKSFLKTSGGKGYHVVVPFAPSVPWDAFRDFSLRVAQVMEQKWPDRYTSNVRKAKRTNKIFIDWIRNGKGATCIAPYSLRARKGATVSMPIAWHELDKIAPDGIDMGEALKRISGKDPWIDFFNTKQQLN